MVYGASIFYLNVCFFFRDAVELISPCPLTLGVAVYSV
jgi:hypothetical protein